MVKGPHQEQPNSVQARKLAVGEEPGEPQERREGDGHRQGPYHQA